MEKDTTITTELEFWTSKNRQLIPFFKNDLIAGLLKLADICTQTHPQRKSLIADFVAGMALYPICQKANTHWEDFERLTNPCITLISKHIKSDEFKIQVIKNELPKGIINVSNGISFTIEATQLLQHSKRKKSLIINRDDVINLYQDWVKYMKENYGFYRTEIKQAITQPQKKGISLTQIALTFYYNKRILQHPDSDLNAEAKNIAKDYGYISGTSGLQLYRRWRDFNKRKSNEITGVEGKKNIELRIEDIKKILPYLNDTEEAKKDINTLENKL
ncbi:MAG: hypothetical protein M9948_14210 [Lentimicrobium sp.]|jgi:hypothetical protein|nr:hypothetical protein [Lentimicrobium sp.]